MTGQEEPLPVVTPRLVVLAVDPVHEYRQPTLVEAARLNDFVTFDALYREAQARGEAAQFAALHELWSWSMSDPVGAFYGREMYEKFARAFDGYARYIDDFRIVDSRGGEYWPTSETRAFLLDRALEGTVKAPLLAEAAAPVSEPVARRPLPPPTATREPAPEAGAAPAEPAPVPAAPAAAPVVAEVAPTVVVTPEPAPAPVVAPAVTPAPAPAPTDFGSRGILLLVIGLVGIGLLAVMLRTPQETMPPVIDTKPVAPVEPIRKPSTPPTSPETPRATGSHG
ncbi:MAG TPA: hypothetical protein VHK90_02600 [Thermoanaerobaculia bacterium]|nr:hypothetical protein [Thermoanaerobaculia bacterium]